jgi:hypothetical protein
MALVKVFSGGNVDMEVAMDGATRSFNQDQLDLLAAGLLGTRHLTIQWSSEETPSIADLTSCQAVVQRVCCVPTLTTLWLEDAVASLASSLVVLPPKLTVFNCHGEQLFASTPPLDRVLGALTMPGCSLCTDQPVESTK